MRGDVLGGQRRAPGVVRRTRSSPTSGSGAARKPRSKNPAIISMSSTGLPIPITNSPGRCCLRSLNFEMHGGCGAAACFRPANHAG